MRRARDGGMEKVQEEGQGEKAGYIPTWTEVVVEDDDDGAMAAVESNERTNPCSSSISAFADAHSMTLTTKNWVRQMADSFQCPYTSSHGPGPYANAGAEQVFEFSTNDPEVHNSLDLEMTIKSLSVRVHG